MYRYIRVILSVVLLVAAVSCSHKKVIVNPKKTVNPTASIVEKVFASQPEFQSATASRANVAIEYQQRKVSANAVVNMITDSAITISVQPFLGVELIRVEIFKSNIVLIDKLNRRYCTVSFAELRQQSGQQVTYNDVEAVLTEKLFAVGQDTAWLHNTPLEMLNEPLTLSFKNNDLRQSFQLDPATYIIEKTSMELADNKVNVTYSNLKTIGNSHFPQTITIDLSVGALSGKATINLQDVKFNTKVNVAPSSVSRLSKVALSTILPM